MRRSGLTRGVYNRSRETARRSPPSEENRPTVNAAPAEPRPERAASLRTFVPVFLLLSFVFLMHLPALGGWWTSDDPQVLLQAVRTTPFEVLFDADSWRVLSTSSFTPLVTLSFEADLALFGLEPLFFYQHQILAICLIALLSFLLLERLCGRILAALVAAAAAVSPAMAIGATTLMVRHYLEGLALALAALLAIRLLDPALRRVGRAYVPALLYLFAMLAKEVFAPLPLLFIADLRSRGATWRAVAMRLIPSALAAAIYVAWRSAMLGSGGGYGSVVDLRDLVSLPARLGAIVAPHLAPWVFWTLVVAALVAAIVGARRAPRLATLWLAATAVALFIPLVPVAGELQARYAIVPAFAAVLLIGAALAFLPRRVAIAIGAALLAASSISGRLAHRELERSTRAMVAEGRYVWSAPSSAPPLLAGSPAWYLEGLRDLRAHRQEGDAPLYFLSRYALEVGVVEPEEVVTSEGGSSELRRLEPGEILSIVRSRELRDQTLPLRLRLVHRGSVVSWEVGPTPGHFIWMSWPELDEYVIPPAGSRRVPKAVGVDRFLVRREEPGGRWTVSPPLVLPADGGGVTWSAREDM